MDVGQSDRNYGSKSFDYVAFSRYKLQLLARKGFISQNPESYFLRNYADTCQKTSCFIG